ncbi:MAG TPA: ThuA domain-containing protein [Humisphaera sp.]
MRRSIRRAAWGLLLGLATTAGVAAPAVAQERLADKPAGARDPFDQSNVPIEQAPADAKAAKIVLIAGDAGTGHPPGDHEHFAGCAMFYRMLLQNPGVAPVMVRDGWPKNPDTLKGAAAVVFYMDGGGKQTTLQHAAEIDALAAAGVGIVHVHQCIDYPADAVPHAIQWLGGAYHPKTGIRGHWDEKIEKFPDHPTSRGVGAFLPANEGYIQKLTFVDGMKGITPIARAKNPKAKGGTYAADSDDIWCFAYERPDGGRSFVNTGGHGHKNWGDANFRRLQINGILWAAKVEVPAGGAKVDMDPADLMQNMEKKAPKPKAATKPAAAKPAAAPAK